MAHLLHDSTLRLRPLGLATLVVCAIGPGGAGAEPAANGSQTGSGALLVADAVYRSVDEHGRVTYSRRPPAEAKEVEPVEVEPGPDAERRRAAEARARELRRAAQRLRSAHREEVAQQRDEVREAEKALREAWEHLEEARVRREEDWQGLAGGGRRLKPSYHQRVRAAKARVERAEKRLQNLRR